MGCRRFRSVLSVCAAAMVTWMSAGCTSTSAKFINEPIPALGGRRLPLRLKIVKATGESEHGMWFPSWFALKAVPVEELRGAGWLLRKTDSLGGLTTLLKARRPQWFSEDAGDSVPLEYSIRYRKTDASNEFLTMLSVFTVFVIPSFMEWEHHFTVTAAVGKNGEVRAVSEFTIRSREHLCLIPFVARMLPGQRGEFFRGFSDSTLLELPAVQDAFLSAVGKLDPAGLRRLGAPSDDEEIHFLNLDQE